MLISAGLFDIIYLWLDKDHVPEDEEIKLPVIELCGVPLQGETAGLDLAPLFLEGCLDVVEVVVVAEYKEPQIPGQFQGVGILDHLKDGALGFYRAAVDRLGSLGV